MTPTAGLEPSYAAIILVAVLVGLCFPLYFSMRKHVRRSTVPSAAEYRAAEQAERTGQPHGNHDGVGTTNADGEAQTPSGGGTDADRTDAGRDQRSAG